MQFPSTPAFKRMTPRRSASSMTRSTRSGAGPSSRIAHDLDREHRSEPAHITDLTPTNLPVEHPRAKCRAEDLRPCDQLFLVEHVEHGKRRRQGDRVPDEVPPIAPRCG